MHSLAKSRFHGAVEPYGGLGLYMLESSKIPAPYSKGDHENKSLHTICISAYIENAIHTILGWISA